jgi:hypothetical protein
MRSTAYSVASRGGTDAPLGNPLGRILHGFRRDAARLGPLGGFLRPLVASVKRDGGAFGARQVCSKFVLGCETRFLRGQKLDHLPFLGSRSHRAATRNTSPSNGTAVLGTIVSMQEVGVYVPDAIPDVQLSSIIIEGEG